MYKKYKFIALILLSIIIGFSLYPNSEKKLITPNNFQIASKTVKVENNNIPEVSTSTNILSDLEKNMSKISVPEMDEGPSQASIKLTSENFEDLYADCLDGKNCDAPKDPWKLYQYFKRKKNRIANDYLITYLSRKKLIDPDSRNQYKNVVKKMIEDFYPTEDRPDAMAEYYMLIEEKQKSLEIYLELEKKFKSDPRKNLTPNLNIGNIYYDLNRFAEALPYYRAAYEINLRDQQNDQNHVEVMDYIIDRINDINKRLNEAAR